MHDLELARLIHADRERELARDQRVRAFRTAQKATGDTFVPPPPERSFTLAGTLRLMPSARRGG
jgi:hypothetical protein